MKTDKHLKELLDLLKNEAPDVPNEVIKSLVNSDKPSPFADKRFYQPRRIKQMFNPLKILVMITPLVILTSVLLIWNPESREEKRAPEIWKTEKTDFAEAKFNQPNKPVETSTVEKLIKQKSHILLSPTTKTSDSKAILKGIILELTNEELTRLGMTFTSNGFMFLNKMGNGGFLNFLSYKDKSESHLFLSEIQHGSHHLIKKEATSLDFYPIAISDQYGFLHYPETLRIKDSDTTQTIWEHINDTLIPVKIDSKISGGYDKMPFIIWFKASETFFSLLETEQSRLSHEIWIEAKKLARSRGFNNNVSYNFEEYSDPDNLLKLGSDVFKCMGFNFNQGGFTNLFPVGEKWIQLSLGGPERETMTILDKLTDENISILATPVLAILRRLDNGVPIYMSFDLAFRVFGFDPIDGMSFNEALDLCLPISIDDTTLSDRTKRCIFWVYPNEHFFQCLPSDIAGPMRAEFNYQRKRLDPNFVPMMGGSIGIKVGGLAKDTTRMGGSIGNSNEKSTKDTVSENPGPVPCVYFTNLCESLPGLDYVNLYPNPATDKLNVDLVLQKAKKIQFRIFDLGGRMISDEGSSENYPEGGQFKHQLDISKLQTGLYLLMMTDEEGGKLTKRFVKN